MLQVRQINNISSVTLISLNISLGWGATQYGSKTSDELMKVELDIFDNDNCNTILSDSLSLTPEKYLDGSQICSGVLEGKWLHF